MKFVKTVELSRPFETAPPFARRISASPVDSKGTSRNWKSIAKYSPETTF
ncbi:MAG: hypothetical protein H6939_10805 [Burkholderiales bacterium]|nr:hypothetical protein [Burkholderiales bacterium]